MHLINLTHTEFCVLTFCTKMLVCAALIVLLGEGEDLDQLLSLSPEELLLRWVNYHLKAAGCKPIKNFNEDIKVGYYI